MPAKKKIEVKVINLSTTDQNLLDQKIFIIIQAWHKKMEHMNEKYENQSPKITISYFITINYIDGMRKLKT
jgi:hypothetical protein